MYKYIAIITTCLFATSFINAKPLPKSAEPPRPIVSYVDAEDIIVIPTPGQPNVIRILCGTLKGSGEAAISVNGTTIVFPITCPAKLTGPFE